ncbi:MAG: hypothetical protein E7503_06445 [Ruminococcus sp.]|nr:hypothetical protein [Ruminococcus sp.]
MAWKLIRSEVCSVDTEGNELLCGELLCDTEADLPVASTLHLAPMSIALIADTHSLRVLNLQGEWK